MRNEITEELLQIFRDKRQAGSRSAFLRKALEYSDPFMASYPYFPGSVAYRCVICRAATTSSSANGL
jgi:hypothetical protein